MKAEQLGDPRRPVEGYHDNPGERWWLGESAGTRGRNQVLSLNLSLEEKSSEFNSTLTVGGERGIGVMPSSSA